MTVSLDTTVVVGNFVYFVYDSYVYLIDEVVHFYFHDANVDLVWEVA